MIYRAVFLIFVFGLSALADDREKLIKVRVRVSAPDSMKPEALSFLTRELRALKDVEVVDNAPQYQLDVVALEISSHASTVHTGYAISAIVTSPFNLTIIQSIFGKFADQANAAKRWDSMSTETDESVTAGPVLIQSNYLRIGPADELAKLCEGLIATIDGDIFESYRKTLRKWDQMIEEEIRKAQQSKNPQ
jgi:hypothetical protein